MQSPSTIIEPPRATRREWVGLGVLAIACVLYAMDLTVLHLAVPRLSADLQPSSVQLLWIIDIYGFLVAGSLITMGTLGDRIGRRRLLLIGAAAFGVASVVAALSTAAEMLIAARALMGVAGATLAPSTLSLIFSMFRDPRQRSIAIGVWITGFSSGAAIGPVLGGLLISIAVLTSHQQNWSEVKFDQTLVVPLMIAFFTTIGFGASVSLLKKGGPQVVLFLVLSTIGAVLQNIVGAGVAVATGQSPLFGVLCGSVSLTGGPGTALAFADSFGELGAGNEGYYLATAFERITLQPVGLIGLTGLIAEVPFARSLLDSIGVEAAFEKREQYKTAFDSATEYGLTPANREMLEQSM